MQSLQQFWAIISVLFFFLFLFFVFFFLDEDGTSESARRGSIIPILEVRRLRPESVAEGQLGIDRNLFKNLFLKRF